MDKPKPMGPTTNDALAMLPPPFNQPPEKRTTKYFGDVEVKHEKTPYGVSHIFIYPPYKGQHIGIYIENSYRYDKLSLVWELVDKYEELHEIAKKAMIESFPDKKSVVHEFFREHFIKDFYFAKSDIYRKYYKKHLAAQYGVTDFNKIDIAAFVEKMDYPSLHFDIEDEVITVVLDYYIYESGNDLDVSLDVVLNEAMQVTDFEIDWGS